MQFVDSTAAEIGRVFGHLALQINPKNAQKTIHISIETARTLIHAAEDITGISTKGLKAALYRLKFSLPDELSSPETAIPLKITDLEYLAENLYIFQNLVEELHRIHSHEAFSTLIEGSPPEELADHFIFNFEEAGQNARAPQNIDELKQKLTTLSDRLHAFMQAKEISFGKTQDLDMAESLNLDYERKPSNAPGDDWMF